MTAQHEPRSNALKQQNAEEIYKDREGFVVLGGCYVKQPGHETHNPNGSFKSYSVHVSMLAHMDVELSPKSFVRKKPL